MKTLGRTSIILLAFAIVMGATYLAVDAGASPSSGAPAFEGGEDLRPGGERPEFRGDGPEGGAMFGVIKGLVMVTVVALTVNGFKKLTLKTRQPAPVKIR